MYGFRDDTHIDYTRHQDLLHQSQAYTESTTPLKIRVTRFYRLFLAFAGRKMIAWGYQIHQKSGIAVEIPLLTPPYAMENKN